jgi:hypothetical protein
MVGVPLAVVGVDLYVGASTMAQDHFQVQEISPYLLLHSIEMVNENLDFYLAKLMMMMMMMEVFRLLHQNPTTHLHFRLQTDI